MIDIEIKRFKIPVERDQEGKALYKEVELNDFYKDSENKQIEELSEINNLAIDINKYNERQLSFATDDSSIIFVFKKVICKPKDHKK